MKIGYARVSTQDQSTDLQLDALSASGCERIFSEKASGAKTDRPELARALEFARSGDTIVVWKLDRLARSMRQLIDHGRASQGAWHCPGKLTERSKPPLLKGSLVFGIFACSCRIRTSLIRERVNAGLQAARLRGRKGGRPPVGQEKLTHASALLKAGYSTARAAKTVGIGRATLCRHLTASKIADAA